MSAASFTFATSFRFTVFAKNSRCLPCSAHQPTASPARTSTPATAPAGGPGRRDCVRVVTVEWLDELALAESESYSSAISRSSIARSLIDCTRWSGLFAPQWMKVLTFCVVVSLAYHAWVGMRDIWMDYVKPVGIRLVLDVITIVWLVGCAGWAVQVLWRL